MSNSLTQAQPLPGCRGRDNFIYKGLESCLALLSSEFEVPSEHTFHLLLLPLGNSFMSQLPGIQMVFLKVRAEKRVLLLWDISFTSFRGICLHLRGTCTARAATGQAQGMHSSSTCEHTLPSVLKSGGGRKIPDEGEGATMSNHCRAILS